jgi:CRISPR-associated protein Cmx8
MTAKPRASQDSLVLDYDLMDLPTAQHKAGLAGLLLHMRSLEQRQIDGGPVVERIERFGASIRFTRQSLQGLFDDLYAASREQVLARSKYANKAPLGETMIEVMRDGKSAQEKRFIYEDDHPTGPVLAHWLKDGKQSPWLDLWRNMLWSILRAQPATRSEFKNRAEGQPVGLADKLWQSLVKAEQKRAKGAFVTDSIAGSLFVGAQDKNAERVGFLGRVEHNLLLHFWLWASPIFVPRAVDPRKGTWDYQGFLLAIPEVADLPFFIDDMENYWRRLDPHKSGYRPADALIDIPAEAGLEFLYQLARDRLNKTDVLDSVTTLELYHQERRGNNVRQLAAERLRPNRSLLEQYQNARDRKAHPMFKALLIGNLVRGEPWFQGAQDLFSRYPAEFFIHGPQTPRTRFFGIDVRRRFEQKIQDLQNKENAMQPINDNDALQRLIYKLIRNYVDRRTRDRAAVGDKPFKELLGHEQKKYREIKPKVATGAFLALRGRREQDITEYFTGTLCAVGYYLSEDDFLLIANNLSQDPERVKDLAMLALSAHSWTPRATDDHTETAQAADE